MFTDLVGSTAAKESLGPEQYALLKSRHDAFIDEAVRSARSGRVIQTTGDGYFLSFDSISRAVSAALLFQWRMTREPWPAPFASRVGLNMGEVLASHSELTGQEDFISSAIDLTSRVMSLAQGGQILMTRSVYDGARHVLRNHPAGNDPALPVLQWESHGPYLFKGAADPVDVFEVGVKGISPLVAPPDSEKASRVVPPIAETQDHLATAAALGSGANASRAARGPLLTRRRVMGGLLIGGPLAAAIVYWAKRRDPLTAQRRAEINREVARVQRDPPLELKQSPFPTRLVDSIQVDNSAFDVLTDERIFDMRAWKEVPPDKQSEYYSPISLTHRVQLRKLAPVDRYEIEGRTQGLDLVWTCLDNFNCEIEAQRTESFVGQFRMKVRKFSVDVSAIKVGSEFTLRAAATYWNTAQTPDEQWFGLIGRKNSFAMSLLVLFPPHRPMKGYSLTVARTIRDTPTPYDGPRIVLSSDNDDWVYWEVPNPQTGFVYRLHWTW